MKVAHLGINAANAENAAQIAELFHVLFGFEPKYGNSSIFVGDKMIEIVKENGRGTKATSASLWTTWRRRWTS